MSDKWQEEVERTSLNANKKTDVRVFLQIGGVVSIGNEKLLTCQGRLHVATRTRGSGRTARNSTCRAELIAKACNPTKSPNGLLGSMNSYC
jgi:hypothetical protein